MASACLFMIPDIKDFMGRKIDVIVPKKTFNPYFLALIFDTNETLIKEKFSHLPGINSVEFLNKKEISKQIEKTVKKLELSENDLLFNKKHMGIRVYFAEEAGRRAQVLIRDYLQKLVGPENITMGSIIRKDKKMEYLDALHTHRHIVIATALGIIFLCWFFLFMGIRKAILDEAYLIEKFQRRNFVGIRIYLSGISSMALIMAFLFRFPLKPHIPWPFLLQITCVLLLTRYKWERI